MAIGMGMRRNSSRNGNEKEWEWIGMGMKTNGNRNGNEKGWQ